MRRMINNTTAIAACLSLLVPPMAQAQAPAEGEQPPIPPAQEQTADPQAEQAAPAEAEAAAEETPADEPVEEPAAGAPAEEPSEPADEPVEEPAAEAAPEDEPEAEAASEPAEEAPAAEAEAQPEASERPAEAAREQQAERPAQAEGREAAPAEADEPAAAEASAEEAPAAAEADAVTDERPTEAARQQDRERPAAPAREQQADRPEPAPADMTQDTAEGEDPLRDALEAEQQAGDAPAAEEAAEPAQAEAPAGEQGDDALREALEQQEGETPAEDQPADAAAALEGEGNTPEADAPVTEAAQQAAQETGAATAAALDDAQEGEVVEQEITEENSRSSSEDFATNLREALEPRQEQATQEQAAREDDDDNDLAKALLLGLGAVAVGTYLNNNRQVTLSAPDRVVVTRADGSQEVIKDEVALLRQPGSTVTTENFDDGSSRTIVTRSDGSRVVTIRDADLRVLRRTLVSPDGTQTRLIDDTAEVEPVDITTLPAPAPVATGGAYRDEAALREALQREVDIDRSFTLGQIRSIPEVRALVPPVTIDAITFDTGSAAISPDQARQLSSLGSVISQTIAENPREMFLIEGHTDTVGADAANLALSDRRAESVALALSEYFDVPPENLVVQGYGEQFLQVKQEGDVRENRRAAVRRITNLLQTAAAN